MAAQRGNLSSAGHFQPPCDGVVAIRGEVASVTRVYSVIETLPLRGRRRCRAWTV